MLGNILERERMEYNKISAFINNHMKNKEICDSDLAKEYFEKNIGSELETRHGVSFFFRQGEISSVQQDGTSFVCKLNAAVDVYTGSIRYDQMPMDLLTVVCTSQRGKLADVDVDLDW